MTKNEAGSLGVGFPDERETSHGGIGRSAEVGNLDRTPPSPTFNQHWKEKSARPPERSDNRRSVENQAANLRSRDGEMKTAAR